MKKRGVEIADADWVHEKFDSIDIEQKREFRKWLKGIAEGRSECLMVQEGWLDMLLAQEHQKLH